ncbi:MAG TPA: NAD-binding protein [Burkholderiales bacterium]|nr:NAD-binding protein [Burkholderiales bacterium]
MTLKQRFVALWPQGPLSLVLVLVGILSVLEGSRYPLTTLDHSRALTGLADSLSALGHGAQIILGLMLVLGGIGLLWRLVSAWTLSLLLLVIMVAVNLAQQHWGLSLALQALLMGVLLRTRHHFTRRTVLARLLFSFSGVLAVLAYGAIGGYLLGKGFRPAILDFDTALYFTVVTLSTVGYGDIVPVTPEARWFVMSLLVIGLGVFASAIASALGPKISGELNRLFNPKERTMEPEDHVILVGEGSIALNTATELEQRGVAYVRIVAARGEAHQPGDRVLEGDATNEAVLRQAGIQRARMLIAAREDDGENAFIVLSAKDLNPKVQVLAVASSPRSIRRLQLARADLVFSPAAVGSRLLADLVQGSQILPQFRDLLEGRPNNT